jgi:hypothetical protein
MEIVTCYRVHWTRVSSQYSPAPAKRAVDATVWCVSSPNDFSAALRLQGPYQTSIQPHVTKARGGDSVIERKIKNSPLCSLTETFGPKLRDTSDPRTHPTFLQGKAWQGFSRHW